MSTPTYEQDFYAWALESARGLRERRFADIDIEHIAEELEDMGKSRSRALESQLARLLAHLLKWAHQREHRQRYPHSWRATIDSARLEIEELLEENPSLKPRLPELLGRAYLKGVKRAVVETDLPEDTFPPQCPWDLQRVLDAQFLPD
jgi:septal ring factor EnvC (AmiA/AmiB activator)